jgi:hypothetical protein
MGCGLSDGVVVSLSGDQGEGYVGIGEKGCTLDSDVFGV